LYRYPHVHMNLALEWEEYVAGCCLDGDTLSRYWDAADRIKRTISKTGDIKVIECRSGFAR